MERYDYLSSKITATGNGHPAAGWTDGPGETADMVYFVSPRTGIDGKDELHLIAEGRQRLMGLIVFGGGVGDLSVEISIPVKAMNELGADTLAVRRELLTYPGFSSMEMLLSRLGI